MINGCYEFFKPELTCLFEYIIEECNNEVNLIPSSLWCISQLIAYILKEEENIYTPLINMLIKSLTNQINNESIIIFNSVIQVIQNLLKNDCKHDFVINELPQLINSLLQTEKIKRIYILLELTLCLLKTPSTKPADKVLIIESIILIWTRNIKDKVINEFLLCLIHDNIIEEKVHFNDIFTNLFTLNKESSYKYEILSNILSKQVFSINDDCNKNQEIIENLIHNYENEIITKEMTENIIYLLAINNHFEILKYYDTIIIIFINNRYNITNNTLLALSELSMISNGVLIRPYIFELLKMIFYSDTMINYQLIANISILIGRMSLYNSDMIFDYLPNYLQIFIQGSNNSKKSSIKTESTVGILKCVKTDEENLINNFPTIMSILIKDELAKENDIRILLSEIILILSKLYNSNNEKLFSILPKEKQEFLFDFCKKENLLNIS